MPADSSKTDEEVAALVIQNKDFFVILIRRYEKKLERYLQRLGMRNPDDRQDLLQVIFLKVYKNINGFDTSLSFSSWIYRIAHNEAVSFFRSRSIRPQGNMIDNSEDLLPELSDDVDIFSEHNEKINAVHLGKALEELDKKYKDVLILRYFEERDYSEISDILQIPIGSVATLIFRAKAQLKKALAHIN